MNTKLVSLRRQSVAESIRELEECARGSFKGVVTIIVQTDGRARFRLDGFKEKPDAFMIMGILDWVKADLMTDLLEVTNH